MPRPGQLRGYCGQLAESIRTDVTLKVVPAAMVVAAALVACPGCVLPGCPGATLDVPVPDGLAVVVVLDVDDIDGLPKVPVTST